MKKSKFAKALKSLSAELKDYSTTKDGQWRIKGFIDSETNIFSISTDTKVLSKIIEIHLFPIILKFATENGFDLINTDHQNYYPDITFVYKKNPNIKYALDLKTSYPLPENPAHCNGFTLGSHGAYFEERDKRKNIQFPYNDYDAHFCLGLIYTRIDDLDADDTKIHKLTQLDKITSVINNFEFFIAEKWKIARDKQGSGNTANIGSISYIADILNENGMFSKLGEDWFDDYWINFNKISYTNSKGKMTKIRNLSEFVKFRKGDSSLIIETTSKRQKT